jgi:hypothetical protein
MLWGILLLFVSHTLAVLPNLASLALNPEAEAVLFFLLILG